MTFAKYSEAAIKALESLAKYKYLTASQMVRLGVKSHRNNIYPALQPLQEGKRPLIDKISFGIVPKVGRLEAVYYLTAKGADFLTDELGFESDSVRFPKNLSSFFHRDYFHRIETIDFHIVLEQWAEYSSYSISVSDFYFDMEGSNRSKTKSQRLTPKTKVVIDDKGSFLVTDAVFKIETPSSNHLFLIEIHNGKDTKRLLSQIDKHQKALYKGAPSIKYGFDKANRVAIVFELESS